MDPRALPREMPASPVLSQWHGFFGWRRVAGAAKPVTIKP